MKPKEIKQWQVFRNSCNTLCLAYEVSNDIIYILSLSGIFYTISKNTNSNYSECNFNPESFLRNYPKDKFVGDTEKNKIFESICYRYEIYSNLIVDIPKSIIFANRKLLLI